MNRKRLLLELFLYAILTIVGLSLLFSRQPLKVEPLTAPIQSEQLNNGPITIPIQSEQFNIDLITVPIQFNQPITQTEGGISLDTIFDQQSEHRIA